MSIHASRALPALLIALVGLGSCVQQANLREDAAPQARSAPATDDAKTAKTEEASAPTPDRTRDFYLARGLARGMFSVESASRASAPAQWPVFDTEQYDFIAEEGFLSPLRQPLSTFSIDVDTASYSNVRRFLNDGRRPPKGAVRIEELVNYFRYDYPPADDEPPFSVVSEVTAAPWQPDHRLVMIGLRSTELAEADQAFRTCKMTIQNIHAMHDLIRRTTEEIKEAGDLGRPDIYFENRAGKSMKEGFSDGLKREEIRITEVSRKNVRGRGGSGKVIGQDIEVKVEFGLTKGRRNMPLSLSFINAFIVNCESLTPIWRLRNLRITNKAFRALRTTEAPDVS